MKIQQILMAIFLPLVLILSGCEATNPTVESSVAPEVTPATAPASTAAVAPKTEPAAIAPPEHCKHHQAAADEHDCIKHCAKHKGKKGKACIKHCENKAVAEHDCTKHCAEHPGEKDKVCAQHCNTAH